MSSIKFKQVNSRRRHLLLGGLAVGATGLLQACGGASEDASLAAGNSATAGSAAGGQFAATTTTVTTPAPIPANQVNLADFGGVPGASSGAIINAFNQAFAKLKSLGGGTLNIGSGVYDLGSRGPETVINVSSLQNVLISGYGAQLTMTTNQVTTPTFLQFTNPNNVTVAGLAFKDFGCDLNTNWRGAICLLVQTTMARSGFKTVDCVADNVVTFLRSDQRNSPYTFTGYDVQGTVRNAYYGIQMLRDGRYSKCNLTCTNVRRAFISHGARDWNVNVTTNRTGGPGSNAHVVFSAFPDAPVQDCKANIIASGALNGYATLGEIIHQGVDGSYSVGRNVKFNFTINNATSAASTGVISFTAEPESGLPAGGIRSSTAGAFENIEVRGTVNGAYNGRMVANPSISRASTNLIRVASNLAAFQKMNALPAYFKLF
jgi:hypothetical protein